MRRNLYILLSSFLAGICIGIGVSVYLSTIESNKIMGAFFFGLGLFTIIHFGLYLYTGRIGAVLDHNPKYLIDMFFCLIGNFIGAFILVSLIKCTRIGDALSINARLLVETKMNDSWYSIFGLSFMCGVLIYIAVKGHHVCPYGVGKLVFAFLALVVFIMCSFEHCVANVAYFTYAGVISFKVVLYFLIMIIGNAFGSIFIDGTLKLIDYLKKDSTRA